jgi:hypothetical protein
MPDLNPQPIQNYAYLISTVAPAPDVIIKCENFSIGFCKLMKLAVISVLILMCNANGNWRAIVKRSGAINTVTRKAHV